MNKKAALVLSGGSILGLAHLGAIEVLQKAGYEFDAIYGVSAGSIVGAGIANGMSTDEIYKSFFDTNFLKIGWDVSKLNTGLLRGEKIQNRLNTIFEGKEINELQIPFTAGTTDFDSGEYLAITKGPIADALRASSSLPMIFEPFYHPEYKKYLADGGLTRNLPLKDAIDEYNGDTIIAINVNPVDKLPNDFHQKKFGGWKKDMKVYLMHSFSIMMNSQWTNTDDERVTIINPKLEAFTGLSIHKKNYEPIIQAGRDAAKEFIENK